MNASDLSTLQWLALAVGAVMIGVSKTGIPGIGILAIVLIAGVVPARASTGLVLPMLILADIFAVTYYRRHAVWRHLTRMLPFAVAGVLAGSLALGRVNDAQLRPIIGIVVLVMLALNAWRQSRKDRPPLPGNGWWFPAAMGILAGITTMMANAAGPIMTIYFLAMGLPKREFIGTGAWYFFLVNVFKMPFSAGLGLITFESLLCNACLAPAVVAGALLGIPLLKRIPENTFTAAVQVLATLGALKLIF